MILKVVLLLVVAILVKHCYKLAMIMGFHKTVYTHWPGECYSVHPVLTGSEDIALISDDNLAFISSGLSISVCAHGDIDPRNDQFVGRIYLFDFNNPEAGALEMNLPEDMTNSKFNPHGMDTWYDHVTGQTYLFVVNHGLNGDTVEVFSFDRKTSNNSLAHVRTYRETGFRSLNDVLAVSSDEFYVTNDAYYRNCWKPLEILLLANWASVVHVTQEGTRIVARGHALNGLGKSPGSIYVTSPLDRDVYVYKRNDDGTLLLRQTINVGSGIDNVFVHPQTMDLWFGAHPIGHAFLEHTRNMDLPAPSQVIRVHPTGEEDDPFSSVEFFEPFSDTGNLISASSSVAVSGNKMLIGSVLHKLAYCEINTPN